MWFNCLLALAFLIVVYRRERWTRSTDGKELIADALSLMLSFADATADQFTTVVIYPELLLLLSIRRNWRTMRIAGDLLPAIDWRCWSVLCCQTRSERCFCCCNQQRPLLILFLLPLIDPLLLLLLLLLSMQNYDESNRLIDRSVPRRLIRVDQSVLCCQSRSSSPLKNRVGHTVLVGLSIVKLVGLIVRHSQDCGISHSQAFVGPINL